MNSNVRKNLNVILYEKEKLNLENQLQNLEQNINQNEIFLNSHSALETAAAKSSQNPLRHHHNSSDVVNGKPHLDNHLYSDLKTNLLDLRYSEKV